MPDYTGPFALRPTTNLSPGQNVEHDVLETTLIVDPYTVTSTSLIIPGPCIVTGITCQTGTSASLALYNGTSATAQQIFPPYVHTLGVPVNFALPIRCNAALYGVLGGSTSGTFTVQARA